MRCAGMGILIMLTAWASADRIIFAPTATKLLNRHVRLEYLLDPDKPKRYNAALGVGLNKDIEVEFMLDRFGDNSALGTMNVSYLYIPAIVDTGPGLAVGMQDVMNRTEDGRMGYFVFTYRMGLDGAFNSRTPMEITLGFGFGHRNGAFTGVQLPFTWQFRGLFEHDSHRARAGLEYRPLHGFAVRAIWSDRETLLSLRYMGKF